MKTLFYLFLLSLVTGCSTLSAKDCEAMDWLAKGKAEGEQGHATQALAEYQKTCGAVGVTPNAVAFLKGHNQGLRSFCTYSGGLEFGKKGLPYEGVCPKGADKEFMTGFAQGETAFNEKAKSLFEAQSNCSGDTDCNKSVTCSFKVCTGGGQKACNFDEDCGAQRKCHSTKRMFGTVPAESHVCRSATY